MKRYINIICNWSILLMLFGGLAFTACGSDDEEDDNGSTTNSEVTSGTWYLVSYDGSECDWGEYLKFSGNTLYWNNRLGGENTTYTFRKTSYGFYCSNSEEEYSFTVVSSSNSRMITASDDGIVRDWKRK